LQKWLARLDAVALDSARLLAGMALAAAAALAFSALLVWAMIWFDGHLPPRSLPVFILVPALVRLLLQPQRLLGHIAAMVLALLVVFLLAAFRLLPDAERKSRFSLAFGLASLALMGGLQAIQPVLAIFLVELLLLTFFQNRTRQTELDKKRALQVWRSLPLQGVLIGSVLWLIF
jgi:asparagine N-glycosylation enzyme membrane subunit Stt3